jgi:hypothetical protein
MTLADIQVLIQRSREASADASGSRGLFGDYRPRPPIPGDELAAVERRLGVELPDEYTRFVTTVADGGLLCACDLFPVQEAIESFVREPFPIEPGADPASAGGYAYPGEVSFKGCIGLTDYGCGSFAVLVVLGAQRGMVWEYHGAGDSLWHTYGQSFLAWLASQYEIPLANYRARTAVATKGARR